MSSASIVMNLPVAAAAAAAAPATAASTGVEPVPAGAGGFDQALAAAQAEPVSQAMVAQMLVGSLGTEDSGCLHTATSDADEAPPETGDATDAAQFGVAAILAQMLAGASPPARTETPLVAEAGLQQASLQSAKGWVASALGSNADSDDDETPASEGSAAKPAVQGAANPDLGKSVAQIVDASTSSGFGADLPALNIEPPPPSQSGNAGQSAVQAAVTAIRDSASVVAAQVTPPATLREPVGTARWADELGNRLVLMSVRGQQQGSLTLTPEHLGPMEVQISVSKDTANVWFGAQHPDTRAALVDAMPRLRELLASSGLSLGQSGVSEQAPREAFAGAASRNGNGPLTLDTDPVETSTTTWRIWRPGILDTYA